jgi:hypothetical protein
MGCKKVLQSVKSFKNATTPDSTLWKEAPISQNCNPCPQKASLCDMVWRSVYPLKVKSCTGRETWMRRLLGTPPTPPLPPPPPLGCLTVLTPFQGLNESERGNQWECGTGNIALRCKVVVSSSSLPESPSSEGDRIGCCCCCWWWWWYSSLDPIANTSKISQPSNLHSPPSESWQWNLPVPQ